MRTKIILSFILSLPIFLSAGDRRLAAGSNQSLAVTLDGEVLFWGNNESNTPFKVRDLENVRSVAAGRRHQLILKQDGTVWAWGRNDFGQLGIGSRIHSQRPLQVLGLSDIQAIAAGGDSSYALKKDGTVWAWGNNQNGQLGNRTTTSRTYPVLMEGLQKVSLIDAGDAFFFAAREDGEVCTWSFRSITLSCQASNAKMIAAGGSTAIILDQSGEVRQEGTAICESTLNRPVLQYVTDVQVGSNYLLMKRDNGSLWVCGEGLPTTRPILDSRSALSPFEFSSLLPTTDIAAGDHHALIRTQDGTVWAIGANQAGQLGTNDLEERTTPTRVFDGTGELNR